MQINSGDTPAAESVIELMRKDNIVLPEDSITNILKLYSDSGNIQASDRFLRDFLTGLMIFFPVVFFSD
jgi:uncharacterized protein YehS (DUF1456 family)